VLIGALFSYAPAEKSVIVFLSRVAASPSPHWQIRRGQLQSLCDRPLSAAAPNP
jgi:hypothetical protein